MSKYEGVHSCGPNCTQPLCVANRRIAELTQALTKCRQAALPDPYDERDTDVHWLQIVILSETDILLKQEVKK